MPCAVARAVVGDQPLACGLRSADAAPGPVLARSLLASLPDRERMVIELRFGLSGEQPATLEEVGRAFGVTRERIRQIENNTLKKLEHLPEAQALRDAVS